IPSPDDPNLLRIDITNSKSQQRFDTQLNLPGLRVSADRRYVLNFKARADAPRSISIGFAKGHSPWSTLGLYDEIELTSEWQPFERAFIVPESENDARLHFDLGCSDASVELSGVTLINPSDGKLVEQVNLSGRSLPRTGAGKSVSEPNVPINSVEF